MTGKYPLHPGQDVKLRGGLNLCVPRVPAIGARREMIADIQICAPPQEHHVPFGMAGRKQDARASDVVVALAL